MSVEKPDDGIGRGVGIAVMVQGATMLSGVFGVVASAFFYCLFAFGLVQWIGLVPFMIREYRNGYRSSVKGIAIMGSIGLLLNTTCAGLIGALPWQHFRID